MQHFFCAVGLGCGSGRLPRPYARGGHYDTPPSVQCSRTQNIDKKKKICILDIVKPFEKSKKERYRIWALG